MTTLSSQTFRRRRQARSPQWEQLEQRRLLSSVYLFDVVSSDRFFGGSFNDQGDVVFERRPAGLSEVLLSQGKFQEMVEAKITPPPTNIGSQPRLTNRNQVVGSGVPSSGFGGGLVTWDATDLSTARYLVGDLAPPRASAQADDITFRKGPHRFTVTISDNYSVETTTLGSSNLSVTDADDNELSVSLLQWSSRDPNDQKIQATFQVNPPRGVWTDEDNGSYSIQVNSAQLVDRSIALDGSSGNYTPAGAIGGFRVEISEPGEVQTTVAPVERVLATRASVPYRQVLAVQARLGSSSFDINDRGEIVFSATDSGFRPVFGVWDGANGVRKVSTPRLPVTVDSQPEVEIANDGTVAISLPKRGVFLFDGSLNASHQVDPELYSVSDSALSDDGDVLVFLGTLTDAAEAERLNWLPDKPALFVSLRRHDGYHTTVLSGTVIDGILDSSETHLDHNSGPATTPKEPGAVDFLEEAGLVGAFMADSLVVKSDLDKDATFTVGYGAKFKGIDPSDNVIVTTKVLVDSRTHLATLREQLQMSDPKVVLSINEDQQNVIPGLDGIVRGPRILDINSAGQVLFRVQKSSNEPMLIRATPVRRPLLLVPGVFGSFPIARTVFNPESGFRFWLMNRGVKPQNLRIDPVARVYDDIIDTLTNAGYRQYDIEQGGIQEEADLFIATYDWRLPNAPADGVFDGTILGLDAAGITDENYEYGVDYLGYWLRTAAESWSSANKVPSDYLDHVDVIAHSMGGLVTRAYIQSDAYGGRVGKLKLPRIGDFISVATPQRGASKAWNPTHNNLISDHVYRVFMRPMVRAAYRKLCRSLKPSADDEERTSPRVITGPDPIRAEEIFKDGKCDMKKGDATQLLRRYAPSIAELLPTFPFLKKGAQPQAINDTELANTLLLDLNSGLDRSFSLSQLKLCVPGDVCETDPSTFADVTNVTAIYSNNVRTIQEVKEHRKATTTQNTLCPFEQSCRKAKQEDYYEDIAPTGSDLGDGTVPLESVFKQFAKDLRVRSIRIGPDATTGDAVDPTETEFAFGGDSTHIGLMSNIEVQVNILRSLGETLLSEFIESSTGTNYLEAGTSILTFIVDPVEAVLVDQSGNRLGWTESTGPLSEIPQSVYVGEEDGVGWIFGDLSQPLDLRLTGIGGDHFVQVIRENASGKSAVAESSGHLDDGERKNLRIEPSPDPPAPQGTVSGVVWRDADADGSRQSSELGLGDISVFLDLNGNGRLDRDEPASVTDTLGEYRLPRISPGSYLVAVGTRADMRMTFPDRYHSVTVSDGSSELADFGLLERISPEQLSGVSWDDLDGDGVRDQGEPGIPGVTVYLDLDDDWRLDPVEPIAVTRFDNPLTPADETGTYSFSEITAGRYHVRMVIPSGYRTSFPDRRSTNKFWLIDKGGALAELDHISKELRIVGETRLPLTDIAFDPVGNLFGITASSLYRIDTATAATEWVGYHEIPGAEALEFDSTGKLFAASETASLLYAIDPNTGDATVIGDSGHTASGDLAFSQSNLYMTADGLNGSDLVTLDPLYGDLLDNVGNPNGSILGLVTWQGFLYGFSGNSQHFISTTTGNTLVQTPFSHSDLDDIVGADERSDTAWITGVHKLWIQVGQKIENVNFGYRRVGMVGSKVVLQEFVSDDELKPTVAYQILNGRAEPFEIAFFSSIDAVHGPGDTEVATRLLVSEPEHLTPGTHRFALELPDLHTSLADSAHPFILAVINSDGNDIGSEQAYFTGIASDQSVLLIRGSDSTQRPDVLRLRQRESGIVVKLNGSEKELDFAVTEITVLANAGADDIRATSQLNVTLRLFGGPGRDVLVGGASKDTLYGGGGGDRLNGSGGADLVLGDDHSEGFRDTIFGHRGNDSLYGGGGNDRIFGMMGNDFLFGDKGNDGLSGGSGNDTLIGREGNDRLNGGRGGDYLSGGSGKDRLFGSIGQDTLNGGLGRDTIRGGKNSDALNGAILFSRDNALDQILGGSGFDRLTGLRDRRDRIRQFELDDRRALPPNRRSLWQNRQRPADVNDDGTVSSIDALLLRQRVGQLNYVPLKLSSFGPRQRGLYYDVNGDGYLSSEDLDAVVELLSLDDVLE